jgi:hypothetical protein
MPPAPPGAALPVGKFKLNWARRAFCCLSGAFRLGLMVRDSDFRREIKSGPDLATGPNPT